MNLDLKGILSKIKPDEYLQKYLKAIKAAKTDEEILVLIDKIYSDGFVDGADSELAEK